MVRFRPRVGFTLIELAMVLVVVSLMTGFGMKAMQGNSNGSCYDKTRLQMRDISAAMEAYARNNSRYPRPAAANLGVTNAKFGKEATDSPSYNSIDKVSTSVYIGALPYATLGLPSAYAADCWGNKFFYMVTQALTTDLSGTGAINIKTGTIASNSDVTTQGAYAVISGGEDAVGMSQRNYALTKKNCNTLQAGAATRVDKENCDTNNAVIFSTAFNNGVNAPNYFDDLVIYKEKAVSLVSDCVPSDVTWLTNCSAPVGALANGGSTTVTNSVTGYTGVVAVSCNNGALSLGGSPTCSSSSCAQQNINWTANGNTCSGPSPVLVDNGSGNITNTASGYTGQATVTCTSGVLSAPTSTTCYANCPAQSNIWLTNCSAPFPSTISGGNSTQTNTAVNYSGSATFLCTNGVWGVSGSPTCISTTCPLQSLTWQTNCSASFPATAPGGSATRANTAANYTGSATYNCVAGVWTLQVGSTCASTSCSAQTISWLSNCSGSTGGTLTSGSSTSVTNTAAGFSGATTATCTNAVVSTSGSTCSASCAAASNVTWLTNCIGNVSGMANGASSTVNNSAVGYTGSETATCTNGTITYSAQSCAAQPCAAASASWGSSHCTAPYSQIASGSSSTVTNTASGYSGSVTLNCTAGTVTQSSPTCNADCTAPGSVTWNTNCAGTLATALTSGQSSGITNTAANYSGSETATCTNGSVTYTSQVCTTTDCTLPWGGSIHTGASVTAYSSATPAGACTSQTRTCTTGTLSGTYTAQTCTAGCSGASPTWLTNCTGTVSALAAAGTATVTNTAGGYTGSETATCNAGGSGVIAYSGATCNANSCTLPWGGSLASGSSVTAYSASAPACGTACTSQSRTCTAGTLSGSYTNQACTSSCCLPWGGSINTGASVTAYSSATPAGACTSQTRTCSGTTLSGTYTSATCTAGCSGGSPTWLTNCTGTYSALSAGGTATVTNTAANYGGSETATCNAGGSGVVAFSGATCSAASCTLPWGGSLANGGTVTAYSSGFPACGSACTSETRTCTGSTLSGTYTSQTCTTSCCLPWGGSINTGASVTAYLSAGPTGACTSQTRTCSGTTLSGTYTYASCTPGCAGGSPTWLTNCSGTYSALIAGTSTSVPNTAAGYTGTETATCNAGGSGAVAFSGASCVAQGCNLPWGGTLANGGTVTAYSSAAPACGSACTSQTRTCSAGTLSGTYTNQSCTSSCCLPWGGSINDAQSTTAYSSAAPAGACTSQTRTCSGVTLSGTYTNSSCTAGCSGASPTWLTSCTGTVSAMTAGTVVSVSNTAAGYTGTETATCNAGGSGVIAYSGATCTAQNCTLPWGGTLNNGSSTTAYSSAAPACGSNCTSETRTCTTGTLSGTYTNQSCTLSCCLPWGGSINDGASVTAYLSSAPSGACTSETRSCTSTGCLSGSTSWNTNCSGPYGALTAGASTSVSNTAGGYAGTITATCNAGGSGVVAFSGGSCSANSCSSPCGTIANGATCTAYLASAPSGACTSEVRTCSNGTLSGTYTNASCTAGCTGTPWGAVASGYSNTAYLSSSPTGACTSQTRTCTAGTMSGTYAYTSCTAGCAATTDGWSSCTGSVPARAAGGTATITNTASGYTGSETATCNAGGSGAWAYSGATCTASCSGQSYGGYCYYMMTTTNATNADTCTTVCASHGGCVAAGMTYSTSVSTVCDAILARFQAGLAATSAYDDSSGTYHYGCAYEQYSGGTAAIDYTPATCATVGYYYSSYSVYLQPVCACAY